MCGARAWRPKRHAASGTATNDHIAHLTARLGVGQLTRHGSGQLLLLARLLRTPLGQHLPQPQQPLVPVASTPCSSRAHAGSDSTKAAANVQGSGLVLLVLMLLQQLGQDCGVDLPGAEAQRPKSQHWGLRHLGINI